MIMSILNKIKDFLELLDSSSNDLDLDELKFILSEAYTTTRQGLEMSNDAMKYKPLKRDFDEIKTNYQVAKSQLDQSKTKIQSLEKEISTLTPLLEKIKNELKGKVSLNNYSKEKMINIMGKINTCNIVELIDLKIDIEDDFNTEWDDSPKSFKAEDTKKFIDFSPFKFGV